MKKLIILAGALSTVLLMLIYCAENDYNYDNPFDKKGTNYLFGDTTKEQEKIGDINNNGISDLFDPTYAITFNATSGTVSPVSDTTRADGRLASLPTPARSGHTFDGWYTAENGGMPVTTGTTFSTNNTIYARWTDNSVTQTERYTITFDYKDTGVSNTILTTGTDGKLASLPETPAISGYTFKGWWTTETTGGDSVTVDWVYSQNTTIYARWEAVPTQPTTYTLTMSVYPDNSGTTNPAASSQSNIQSGTRVNISATAANNYIFVDWTVTDGNATIADANSAATMVTLSSNATIRANFRQDGTPPEVVVGTLADSRDGKRYKTVTIRGQTWMAENLNYDGRENGSEKGVCYGNSAENCAKYGRLYNWATAMDIDASYNSTRWNGSDVNHQGACPAGWHVPSDAEWTALTDFVGSNAGTKLKSSTGWNSYSGVPVGTDQYGFTALPGGGGYSDGYFSGAGNYGYWWSATEYNAFYAWYRDMYYYYGNVYRYDDYKTGLCSVRCAQD